MKKYGIFREDELVGRIIFKDFDEAKKWNDEFLEAKRVIGREIKLVEAKEYKTKRLSKFQRLKELM